MRYLEGLEGARKVGFKDISGERGSQRCRKCMSMDEDDQDEDDDDDD